MITQTKNQSSIPAAEETSIGRIHVESEESLSSVREFPKIEFTLDNFVSGKVAQTQILSSDLRTGESTQRLQINQGWTAPIGHFTTNVEIFVLQGELSQGGFRLRELSYSFIPPGVPTGPWVATEDTIILWMPDATPSYIMEPYSQLAQIPENSAYHINAQKGVALSDYIPVKEVKSMPWETTTFLPPGSARRSLYTNKQTGRATWILGLVPMWIEGNFLAGHPTTEEAYMISGDVSGHWCMQDDPFNRRYATMEDDGYYWRPAHIPHGPFWTKRGALMLFRTNDRLDCNWILHNTDIGQQNFEH
ncbi:MAG TPA: hypothetical protein DCF68_16715 [Cyanothece sp. UBA12306]|nr:hypothetical protein [Cyanothece sp. UBA12306]